MESTGQVAVPLRSGGKKMKKRRELDALVAHSLAKRACNSNKRQNAGNGITSQDQLLSQSTDEQDDYTWSKVRVSSRERSKRFTCIRTCGPLILLMSVFLSFGFMYWLYFDLRQQIYEYRMRIEEVTATSQSVPDALQQWHESSKSLEQNQTEIYKKLTTIQEKLEIFDKQLIEMKEQLNKKNEESGDNKVAMLEKNMASFGAKIEDFSIGVTALKEKYNSLQKESEESQKNYTQLKTTLDATVNISSPANSGQLSKEVLQNFTQKVEQDVKNLSGRLDSTNDTLSQKLAGLNVESLQYKKKLEELTDNNANMSAIVQSIENAWTNYKKQAMDFEKSSVKLNSEISQLKNRSQQLGDSVSAVNDKCDKYHSDAVDMLKMIQTNASALFTESNVAAKKTDEDGRIIAPTALPPFLMNTTELTNNSTSTNSKNTSAPVEVAAAGTSAVPSSAAPTNAPAPTSTSKQQNM